MAQEIYENQPLRIEFEDDNNISEAISYRAEYLDPNGLTGNYTGYLLSGETTITYCDIPKDILTFGTWKFQMYIEMTEGNEYPSGTINIKVKKIFN